LKTVLIATSSFNKKILSKKINFFNKKKIKIIMNPYKKTITSKQLKTFMNDSLLGILSGNEILNKETKNGMPKEVILLAKEKFTERLKKIDWNVYYKSWPFNESALTLYDWAPIAEELKSLDRKIVLNSMILKWDNIKDEFAKLIKV